MRTPEASVLDRISASDFEEQVVRAVRDKQGLALASGEYDGLEPPLDPHLLYEDPDFSPDTLSTLYIDPDKLPEYAPANGEDGAPNGSGVAWRRPQEMADAPAYFTHPAGSVGVVREGALRDAWLLGVVAAVALHPDNLIENLFASESLGDFVRFGVFSCRFFKDEEWVTVTTDTRLPCTDASPANGLLYGSSLDRNELFVPLIEKAYAKLHGSYEALDAGSGGVGASSRVLEAFLDLTGGSAHRVDLQHDKFKAVPTADGVASEASAATLQLWRQVLRYRRRRCVLAAQVKQLSFHSVDQTALGLLKNRLYVLLYTTEVTIPAAAASSSSSSSASSASGAAAAAQVLRFVKLQSVWGRGMWKGEWSNDDSKWEEQPQVEHALRSDPASGFSRAGRDGCFWMRWEDFVGSFSELFVAHVFADEAAWHQYSVRGEWAGLSAAGAPSSSSATVRLPTAANRPVTSVDSETAAALPAPQRAPREVPVGGTRWAVLRDADASWFHNPQFRLSVRERTPGVLLSLVQRDFRLYGGDNFAINFVLLQEKAPSTGARAWEFKASRVIAEAHSMDPTEASPPSTAPPTSAGGSSSNATSVIGRGALPDRELVLKDELVLEPGASYLLVPFTDHARVEMEFFLRVFAPKPVRVEQLPPLFSSVRSGRWRNDQEESGEPTNAGGPLCPWASVQQAPAPREVNAAWCQNPQFWVRLPSMTADGSGAASRRKLQALLASKAHATMKITLVKTSHRAGGGAGAKKRDAAKDRGLIVGITTVRAAAPVSATSSAIAAGSDASGGASSTLLALRAVAKAPKTNFLGEELAPKGQSSKATSPKRAQAKSGDAGAKHRGVRDGKAVDGDENDVDAFTADLAREHAVAEAKLAMGGPDAQQPQLQPETPPRPSTFPSAKLVVAPDEWARVSEYTSPVVACMHLKRLPKEWLVDSSASSSMTAGSTGGGLLIVPSLGEAGVEGTFELTVDCDLPVRVDALPTLSTQSVAGEWREGASGGCHLHADWRKNPRFYLELKGVRPGRVAITLSRSELEWSGKCKRDVVGTMMGFYLFAGSSKVSREPGGGAGPVLVNGRPWTETDFVPMHAVRSPPELVLPAATKEPYVIIPATYEPGKHGRFVLSVQCDTEFVLTSDAD